MSRKRLITGAAALIAMLALGGVIAPAGTAVAGAPPLSIAVVASDQHQLSIRDGFRIEQTPTQTGRTRVKIDNGGNGVTVTVTPGAKVAVTFTFGALAKDGTSEGTAQVDVAPPRDEGVDPETVAGDYRESGRSVITDAMETGMSYEDAMAQFGSMDPESNPTKAAATQFVQADTAPAATPSPAGGSRAALLGSAKLTADTAQTAEVSPMTTAATIYDSWCADLVANGGDQTAHACIIRYLDYSSGGLRYWTHKQKVTGKDDSFWMVLSSVTQWYVAPTGNYVIDWDPETTQSVGSCGTMTFGVTDPKTGVGASYSSSVCPDKIGPKWSDSSRGYGSFWGGASNDYRGAHSASVVKTNPGYSSSGVLKVAMSWHLN